jgi:hypothetical protein
VTVEFKEFEKSSTNRVAREHAHSPVSKRSQTAGGTFGLRV